MKNRLIKTDIKRKKRTVRNRRKVKASSVRPRLSVFRSNRHISAQIIDDESGVTLVGLSSQSIKGSAGNKETAKTIGAKVAELAKAKNVEKVVFDRGCYKYHGVVAELANAAREAGLQF